MTETIPIEEMLTEALAAADALDGTLDDKNASYWAVERALLPELDAAYAEFISRVADNEAGDHAPKVGEPMPEFLLPDGNRRLVGLSTLLAGGPLVLSFNRGNWCPFCRLELKGLARINDEVEAIGGRIVSIVPETAEYTRAMRESYGLPFELLTDLDLGYALENGLVVAAGGEIRRLYLGYGIDFAKYQGNPAWFMPTPATFVLDRDGIVRERFVDVDFRRRMPLEAVLAALRRLA